MDTEITIESQAKPTVDANVFRNGLGCLGKTFNNARHAYLSLNIQSKSLDTLHVSPDPAILVLFLGNPKVQIPCFHRCFRQQPHYT